MAFATVQIIRENTSFEEITELSDTKIQKYIDLANAFLRRYTGQNYRGETDPDLLIDLERVTLLLVEYLWLGDQPEVKESNYTGLKSERIGTYSYNINPEQGTGNIELDQLLESLTSRVGLNFFSVSGPTKPRDVRYNEHVYVTKIEEE